MEATGKKRTETRRSRGGGYLYVITNPAWPGHCKVGRTVNVVSRLRTYQTHSPYRDYRLHYHRWFPDVWAAEAAFKRLYPGHRAGGEWQTLHPEDAANLIDRAAAQTK